MFISAFMVSHFRAAYVSYGGLLMRLQGDANNLQGFEVDHERVLADEENSFLITHTNTFHTILFLHFSLLSVNIEVEVIIITHLRM